MIHRRSALQNSADALTLGSMAFTGFFGWVAGGDYIFFCVVGAAVGAVISFASPLLWKEVGRRQLEGRTQVAVALAVFASIFLIVDALTNIGSVFAMRQTEIVGSQHQTQLAGDARNEIGRLETRIGEIRNQTAWKTTYLAPGAYDKLIVAAQLIRDNEEKRGGCGPLCEQKTKELADLQANKANAEHRLALKAEMKQLESELVDAKAASHDTPPKVSAAWTQVEKLAALATLNIDPSQSTKEIAYLLITGIFGLVTSIGAAVLSWAFGLSGGHQSSPGNATVSEAPYLQNHSPVPNHHVPASTWNHTEHTVVIPGGTVTGNAADQLRALRQKINETMREVTA